MLAVTWSGVSRAECVLSVAQAAQERGDSGRKAAPDAEPQPADETPLVLQHAAAQIERFESGEAESWHLVPAISLRHDLSRAGQLEAERDLIEAALAAELGDELGYARFWYYLAMLDVRERRPLDALPWLDQLATVVLPDGPPDEHVYWRERRLGERHYLHLGRAEVFRSLGLLDIAAVHRSQARAALSELEAFCAEENKVVPPGRYVVHTMFELDFELARMRYSAALRIADEALSRPDVEWSPDNKHQLERRRAAALGQLALADPSAVEPAISALEGILMSEVSVAEDRLDGLYRLARLFVEADREAATGALLSQWSASTAAAAPDKVLARALIASVRLDAERRWPSGEHAELDRVWTSAYADLLALWQQQPAGSIHIASLHFDKSNYVVDVGVRSALALPSLGADEAMERLALALDTNDLTRARGAAHVPVDEWAPRLPDGEAVVAIFPTPRGGVGFAATASGVESFEVASNAKLRRAGAELRNVLSRRPAAPSARAATDANWREASAAWWGDALAGCPETVWREGATVHWLATELTFHATVEAVLYGDAPLSERVVLVHSPSPALLPMRQQGRSGAGGAGAPRPEGTPRLKGTPSAAIVANVPATGWVDPKGVSWPRVDVGSERVASWGAHLGTFQTHEGDAGTRDTLRGGVFRGKDVAIVFAHGCSGAGSAGAAGIVLGADELGGSGYFVPSDVEMSGAPDVVLLAVCGGASSSLRLGSGGAFTLAGRFEALGARTVIAATDDLPTAATAALVDAWTEGLSQGLTVGEALRLARVAVRTSGAAETSFDGALLRLHGDPAWRLPGEAPASSGGRLALVAALALLGACIGACIGALALAARRRSHARESA